MKNMGVGVSK